MKKILTAILVTAGLALAQSGLMGGSDGIHQMNAKTLGQWGFFVGTGGNIAFDAWALSRGGDYFVDGEKQSFRDAKISASGNIFIGLGVADNIDVGVGIPLYYDRVYAKDALDAIGEISLGDLNLWGKMKAPFFSDSSVVSMAAQIDIFIPTFASFDKGIRPRHAWYLRDDGTITPFSANEISVDGIGILTLDLTRINIPIRWNGNVGLVYVVHGTKTLIYGTGLNFPVTDWMEPFVEYSGELRLEKGLYPRSPMDDPMLLTPGLRFHLPYGVDIALGADVSARTLTNLDWDYEKEMEDADKYKIHYKDEKGKTIEYSYTPAPPVAFTGLLTWRFGGAPKADERVCPAGLPQDTTAADTVAPVDTAAVDTVKADTAKVDTTAADTAKPEPVVLPPRDFDGDGVADSLDVCPNTPDGIGVDSTGCPLDFDHDGVADFEDRCPNTASGIQVGRDGCPLDFDRDGVPDNADMCPNTKKGVAVDSVGCMLDADKDGVGDTEDKCPNTPKGAAVDETGCPLDTDKDGVPDYLDKCPNTLAGVKIDAKGCPVNKKEDLEKLKQGIEFQSGSAKLTKSSYKTLDDIIKLLKKIPSANLEVQGHTDNTGSAEKNKKLSQERAQTVVDYFVSKGIASERVRAVGFGPDKPIADNKTSKGRAKNRRVELVPYSRDDAAAVTTSSAPAAEVKAEPAKAEPEAKAAKPAKEEKKPAKNADKKSAKKPAKQDAKKKGKGR